LRVTGAAPVITIDGPGGAGKGAVSSRLASHLRYGLLDSGALYRALALAARRHGISLDAVSDLAGLATGFNVVFSTEPGAGRRAWLDGEDRTEALRSESCGDMASRLASIPAVREALVFRQRAFRKGPGLVAEGRDMGTVIFPDATLKIYLTASLEERAHRRHKQLMALGIGAKLADLLEELSARDQRDMQRKAAPLAPAVDAVIVDSTGRNIDQVFAGVVRLVNERQPTSRD